MVKKGITRILLSEKYLPFGSSLALLLFANPFRFAM